MMTTLPWPFAFFAEAQVFKELDTIDYSKVAFIFTLAADLGAFLGADGQEYSLIAFILQTLQVQSLYRRAKLDFHAHSPDQVNLMIEDVFGEPVIWYPGGRHASRKRERLKDCHLVAPAAQLAGGC